ncbi:MAG TPA: Gfo/Idh/MocA family oxidoreductase, partial [Candidatus Entotheonella sp.]
AGKHVFTEWPLGKDTAEAVELAALAKQQGVQAIVGLQARAAAGVAIQCRAALCVIRQSDPHG